MESGALARQLEGVSWFDLWHTHVDWSAQAEHAPERCSHHFLELFTIWDEVDRIGCQLKTPWQSWVLIDPVSPSEDAVYLHTLNPNQDNFPYPFEDVKWGVELPVWLTEYVSNMNVEMGRSEPTGDVLYWVRRAN